jgi:hypothetical protein
MSSATTVRRVVLSIIGVLLALAVASGGIGIQLAASKTALVAPTITSTPANPTSSTSATFVFTDPAGATLQCQLDTTPVLAGCTSPKVYTGPLAHGPHTFQVKAVAGSAESAATSYTWTVDLTPPPAPSITAKPAALSNTTSPSFSFSDIEIGVTFRCQLDGSAYAACTIPRSYSNLTQGSHTFSVQAVDPAGNPSPANPTATWSWSIDRIAPAAPVLTTRPDDPTYNATNIFAWTAETGATFQCSVENGAWFACPTPYTYVIVTSNYGQHQFAVRAIDAAGNISAGTSYSFKYEKKLPTSGVPFAISGTVTGLTLGVWKPIAVTINNPNNAVIYLTNVTVAISAGTTPGSCLTSYFDVQQSNITTSLTVSVPAGSTNFVLPSPNTPQLRLRDEPTINQDICKSKSFTLTYSGTATN